MRRYFIAAVIAVGLFVRGGATPAAGMTDDDFLFENLANDRAISYYVSGLTAADSDEENGNAYNWGKSGTVTINGVVQKFEDGTTSEDRCVPPEKSDNSDSVEPELVEHWYAYDSLEGVVIKRSRLECSSFQYGTECKAGACVPVSVPPDDFVITKTAKCEWLFGDCFCPSDYNPTNVANAMFCENRVNMTWRYNVISGIWEKIDESYFYSPGHISHPEWIYSSHDKDAIARATAAFNAGPEPFQVKKPEWEPTSRCVRDLVDNYRSLFDSCFQQVGPGHRFNLADCVAKSGGDAYKQAALKCEWDYQNSRSPATQHSENNNIITNAITEQPVEQPIGVSSLNIRELARANAELQRAEADLEAIKQSNDPRWQVKKEFQTNYKSALDEYADKVSADQQKELLALRLKIEDVHELFAKGKDFYELPETLAKIEEGGLGDYTKLDFSTDAVKGFNEYHDQRAKGVTAADASAKALLDNFGTSALTINPLLKTIDVIATTPDMILKDFGIDEDNWSRKYVTNGAIGKFAPSGVVTQTTSIMVDNNWSDMGNTLAYAWGKVKNADGIGDAVIQFGMFEDVVIGTVPVAIARGFSELAGATIFVGSKAIDFVSSWFTY